MLKYLILFFLVFPLAVGCAPKDAVSEANVAPEAQNAIAQKAAVGVGKQGQSLEDNTGVSGMVSGPVSALFKVKQGMVFDVAIPQAMQLFQASNGRVPNSHEEFMEKIISANRIQLPELPQGQVYRFNVEKNELWVYPEDEAP